MMEAISQLVRLPKLPIAKARRFINGEINQNKLWSESTVTKMRQLLHEVTVSGTAKGAYFPTGYIGGKTGTTNDYKDLWFVGLTDHYTTGVWMGKDTPASIEYLSKDPHMLKYGEILVNKRNKKRETSISHL